MAKREQFEAGVRANFKFAVDSIVLWHGADGQPILEQEGVHYKILSRRKTDTRGLVYMIAQLGKGGNIFGQEYEVAEDKLRLVES